VAISFGAVSAKTDATGASTVAATYPTGVAAGHLALAIRNMMSGVNTVTFLDEAGWSELADFVGGTGNVADAHNSRLRVGSQVLTGSESGTVTFDASANCSCMAMMARYSNGTGAWDVVGANGDDATHGANRAATAGTSLALAPGDVVVCIVSVDTDAALTITSPTITASGITFGTVTRRTSGAGSTAGLDGNIEIFDATVSTGTATVAPSFSMTTATSQCGPVAFVRLRETSSGTTGAGAAAATQGTASGAGTATTTGAGAATAASGTASGAGTSRVTGSGTATGAAGTASGAGASSVTGAGAPTAPAGTAAGAGTSSTTGAGDADAPGGTATGAGTSSVAGSGASSAQAGQASGSGTATTTGAGSATAPAGEASGSSGAIPPVEGSGAAQGQPGAAAGTGTATTSGDGEATATEGAAAGVGTSSVTGSGAATAPEGEASGTGAGEDEPFREVTLVRPLPPDYTATQVTVELTANMLPDVHTATPVDTTAATSRALPATHTARRLP
jgi:hypothetical protein